MTKTLATFRRLGYARVSTVGQTLKAQLEQLAAAGCSKILREKLNGAQAKRKELNLFLNDMQSDGETDHDKKIVVQRRQTLGYSG